MKRARLASLDAVRAFACLAVLAYHMHLVHFGHLGVALFFVMGGFLSVYNHLGDESMENPTLKGSIAYSHKRIAKLYPLYFVGLLIPFAGQVYGAVNHLISVDRVLLKLAANVLAVQAWIPINEIYFSLNGPAWYLSAIAFCYFAFPWLLKKFEKFRNTRAAFGVACAIWLAQIAIGFAGEWLYDLLAVPDENLRRDFCSWLTYVFPVFRFGDFAVGGCAAYIFLNRNAERGSKRAWTWAELGAIALAALAEYGFEHSKLPFNDTSAYLPACVAVIYVFAVNKGSISQALTNKVTKHIAGISTELFLTHAVVIFACSPVITSLPISGGAQKAIYVIAIPILSYIASLAGRRFNAAFARRAGKDKAGTA